MTAEDRAQIRDGAAGGGASGTAAGDEAEGEDSTRIYRPARSGAAAGEGAARAGGGGVPSEPGAGDSFGAWLRRQREMREIDLREIAEKTKISLRYLKAMEQDRFEVLPAPVFARGFLREYARYVGLNPDEVVNYYLSTHAAEEDDDETEGTAPSPSSRGTLSPGPLTRGALVTVLVLLAVAALVYFLVYQGNRSEQEEAAPPPIAPPVDTARPAEPAAEPAAGADAEAASEQSAPAPAPAAPLVVTLDFTEQCWVEARVEGGEQVSRLFVAGESLRLEGEERVVLQTLGNAGGVEVQVNGRPLPVTAGPTGTARDVVIDLADFGGAADAGPGEGP